MNPKPFFILLLLCSTRIFAQEKFHQELKPFLAGESFVSMSGPGENIKSGDLLLITENKEEEAVYMKVLRWQTNGTLKLIVENDGLLMSSSMYGNSGSSFASLQNNIISVSVSIGSNSGYGNTEIDFKKGTDGNYYFSDFTAKNFNYGREDYFSHLGLTSKEMEEIKFQDADEAQFWNKLKMTSPNYIDQKEEINKYKKKLPKSYSTADIFAIGDLNGDIYKNDLILGLENKEIILLLAQADGTFKKVAENKNMIYLPDDFNPNNLKIVIKNGYFTIEQRIGNEKNAFNHYYATFKYDKAKNDWLLHRIGIECYQDYESKPIMPAIQKNNKDFGIISFKNAAIQKIIQYNPKKFQLVKNERQ